MIAVLESAAHDQHRLYRRREGRGTGKTTTAHLACLGAILRNHPAAYVLTDPGAQSSVRRDDPMAFSMAVCRTSSLKS